MLISQNASYKSEKFSVSDWDIPKLKGIFGKSLFHDEKGTPYRVGSKKPVPGKIQNYAYLVLCPSPKDCADWEEARYTSFIVIDVDLKPGKSSIQTTWKEILKRYKDSGKQLLVAPSGSWDGESSLSHHLYIGLRGLIDLARLKGRRDIFEHMAQECGVIDVNVVDYALQPCGGTRGVFLPCLGKPITDISGEPLELLFQPSEAQLPLETRRVSRNPLITERDIQDSEAVDRLIKWLHSRLKQQEKTTYENQALWFAARHVIARFANPKKVSECLKVFDAYYGFNDRDPSEEAWGVEGQSVAGFPALLRFAHFSETGEVLDKISDLARSPVWKVVGGDLYYRDDGAFSVLGEEGADSPFDDFNESEEIEGTGEEGAEEDYNRTDLFLKKVLYGLAIEGNSKYFYLSDVKSEVGSLIFMPPWRGGNTPEVIIPSRVLDACSTYVQKKSGKFAVENRKYMKTVFFLSLREQGRVIKGYTNDPGLPRFHNHLLNLYTDKRVEPEKPSVLMRSYMKDVVLKVLCRGRKDEYKALLELLAAKYKHPERRLEVCTILKGVQGCGKDVFFRLFSRALGNSKRFDSLEELTDTRFNMDLAGKLAVVISEIGVKNMATTDTLKSLITGETSRYEQKYEAAITLPNFYDLFCGTNHEHVVRGEDTNRRFFLLDTQGLTGEQWLAEHSEFDTFDPRTIRQFAGILDEVKVSKRRGQEIIKGLGDIASQNTYSQSQVESYLDLIEDTGGFPCIDVFTGKLMSQEEDYRNMQDIFTDFVSLAKSGLLGGTGKSYANSRSFGRDIAAFLRKREAPLLFPSRKLKNARGYEINVRVKKGFTPPTD